MKLTRIAIDRTIRQMCAEVNKMNDERACWRHLSEDELFYEIAVCIIGSQMRYEHALDIADFLKDQGLLSKSSCMADFVQYAQVLTGIFSKPLEITKERKTRTISMRFKNRIPKLLADTAKNIYENGQTINGILTSAVDSLHARELLVHNVRGFGPKQASLFLRRIGYCSELAVLDTHILDYLRLAVGIEVKPWALARLKWYENIEAEFRRISNDFGYSVGCVDLAMWITMRVAKREFAI
jgi:N-glycosylase/DNA lyase